ncbi:MAG: mercuric reductase [Blastopirellula sp.]|nr:MAG: mercuric reductase [Blastopirellula sp.]
MGRLQLQPNDKYNAELVNQTHPADWQNPTPAGKYNLVAIGGGSAGIISALGTAGLGGKSALIERHLLGGDCLNYGCVPSKAIIRASKVAHTVKHAAEYGIAIEGNVSVSFEEAMTRMRKLRSEISHHDSAERFKSLGADVYLGQAKFTGPDTIEVNGQELQFAKCVVATGGRASIPSIPGLEEAGYLTNESLFSLTTLPKRIAVLGTGAIGAEMAQAFQRLGSQVFAVGRSPLPLSKEDPAAGEVLKQQFEQDGMQLYLRHTVEKVESSGDAKQITLKSGDSETVIEVDEILVALGRQPNVEGLDLEKANIQYNNKGLVVDDRLRTTNPKVYAAGDIAGSYQFTHAADAMARICLQNALFHGRGKLSQLNVPRTTYTSPEVAHVGITPQQALKQGIEIDSYREDMANVDRAILDGQTSGFAVIHTQKGKGKVLGATIVGPHAGEMISEITLLMNSGKPLSLLASTIHCYPTQAEVLKRIADQYQKTKLTPFVKNLFYKWLAWNRK